MSLLSIFKLKNTLAYQQNGGNNIFIETGRIIPKKPQMHQCPAMCKVNRAFLSHRILTAINLHKIRFRLVCGKNYPNISIFSIRILGNSLIKLFLANRLFIKKYILINPKRISFAINTRQSVGLDHFIFRQVGGVFVSFMHPYQIA